MKIQVPLFLSEKFYHKCFNIINIKLRFFKTNFYRFQQLDSNKLVNRFYVCKHCFNYVKDPRTTTYYN